MKTTFKFIIAAMAAISVFSSCQKELVGEISNNTTDGIRTIAVQFDNSTKASLNGLKPTFNGNDKIRVSNTEKSEECTITIDNGGTYTFTTTLSGTLTAIYPADAAVLSSDGEKPIVSPYFNVSASQDGTIAKAIIARADISAQSTSATFNVQTALFQIAPPSGATSITITSLNKIDATTGQRSTTANAVFINTEGADDAAKRVITVTVPTSGDGKAYVALVPGVNLSDLSFDAGGTYGMKGIPTSKISIDATAANTKYTIGSSDWHPYVEIQMTINGVSKTYKWATMNIGATETEPNGTYFAWAGTTGQAPSESSFSPGFSWTTCPFAVGGEAKFNKYVPASKTSYLADGFTGDTKTVLDLADDAANANWGGSWRMPTKAEFGALASETKVWDDTNNGYTFGTSPNTIFLPAAGGGNGSDLIDAGFDGYYWSSSLSTDFPNLAYYLRFYDGYAYTRDFSRYYGLSVRALSE